MILLSIIFTHILHKKILSFNLLSQIIFNFSIRFILQACKTSLKNPCFSAFQRFYGLFYTFGPSGPTKIQAETYQKQEWTPIFPAPSISVDLQAEPQLRYMLKGRQETARYEYKDADDNTLGYVVRLEDKQGNKITPTLTYCQNDKGENQWRWQGFGNDRPLYGLDQLKQKPEAPVLIVEGEKTAEAAKALFADYAVVTWSGGCGAVQKSDWSVLKERKVMIWPDHDQPGLNAALKITEILNKQDNERVATADLPSTLPHKWDLADQLPEGLDVRELLHVKQTIQTEKAQSIAREPIDQIIKSYGLDLSFGGQNDKDYERIHQLQNHFKELYAQSEMPINDEWILKRSTYIVFYLREYGKLTQTEEERFRCAMIASSLFANQEKADLSLNSDAHFKAIGKMKDHDESAELKENNLQKEIYGSNVPQNIEQRSLTPIHRCIQEIHTQIQNEQSEQLQKNLTPQKDLSL